ncbi:hypothetical protein PINS_up001310 [Pythium insidiosum]|nr:hypothetical protein PINS_up001310 [Pythium insidiosum]
MVLAVVHDGATLEIDERRSQALEHAIYHPHRDSIVSVTYHSLQELDPRNGALISETAFDLLFLVDRPPPSAPTTRLLELVQPAGLSHVVAIFQSRCLVVWDLQDCVLQSITEVEKQQKSIVAMAASLDKEHWLFYASEGSNSIKVTAIDSRDPPKKISRKAANRSSQITCLAYLSARRLLCAGGSDGSLQLWSFSEENALGGKEEAAVVTPVFATPTSPSPVVHVAFQQSGAIGYFISIGYQSRVLEVWDLAPLVGVSSRQREPFRVTTLHAVPPQAADFGRKTGELSCHLHPQLPLLLVHWQSYATSSSCVAAAELAVGGGDAVTLSNWLELFSSPDDGGSHTALLLWPTSNRAYLSSTHHRQLAPLRVDGCSAVRSVELDNARLSLSSTVQLSLDQYFRYSDVPSTLLQVARVSSESSAAASTALPFQLQSYSLLTAETHKLGELPTWNNYQGRQLLPWRLLANDTQSAVCLLLHEPARLSMATTATALSDVDATVSYVVVEASLSSSGGSHRGDDTDGGDGDAAATSRLKPGAIMDAMDVCFAPSKADDKDGNGSASRAYTLLVLASTGKSLCVQTTCDHVDDSSRVLLTRDVQRVFATPLPTRSSSAVASAVGVRVLYKLKPSSAADAVETLVLSEDDLSMPPLGAGASWSTSPEERLVDVVWNAVGGADPEQAALAAVWTTQRFVVLSGSSLTVVASYELSGELAVPHSVLWMAQTLLVATGDGHVRCLTPLRSTQVTLLASLAMTTERTQRVQLLCACGDRLGLAVSDARTAETRTSLRPIAVCEPLLLGFTRPNDRLRAILERDVLVFAGAGGQEPRCPISSDALLTLLYDDFGWTETTVKALDVLLSSGAGGSGAAGSSSGGGGGGGAGGAAGSYAKTSALSPQALASVYLSAQRWRDALRALLATDPGLEEYVLADDDSGGSSAKLPSRSGAMARQLRRLARVFASLGQLDLALKCLDTAGDDLGILSLAHDIGVATAEPLLTSLQKDWARLNPPLASLASTVQRGGITPPPSVVWRRHDLFSLLCCAQLTQPERRSRLLASRREDQEPKSTLTERASVLYWRRLAPEDAKDILGLATTPHVATEEPKNPSSYAAFGSASGSSALGLGDSSMGLTGNASGTGGVNANANSSSNNNDKQTIGPFLEDEDAVVAYWRFEEGTTANEDDTARTLESLDTSKRENHLQIAQFQSLLRLAASTAPVDRGEEGKLQEEFSLRFPRTTDSSDVDEWSARCSVRAGSTLDIGFVFDEDPYRRKLTVELWVRDVVLFTQRQQEEQGGANDLEDDDGVGARAQTQPVTTAQVTAAQQPCSLVSRRGADGSIWWELGLDGSGRLALRFNSHSVVAEEPMPSLAAWQHVAFSVDITSPKQATLKLFVQARCVATKDVGGVDANAKLVAKAAPSSLHLGYKLQDLELTEVRVWATARTVEQLSDMKENYLGIAEAKRRMKITIHNRNCQCDKCLGRRTKTPTGKVSLLSSPFPSTPPSSGPSRDRRRPQPKPATATTT